MTRFRYRGRVAILVLFCACSVLRAQAPDALPPSVSQLSDPATNSPANHFLFNSARNQSVPPHDIGVLDELGLRNRDPRVSTVDAYGWIDMGYTYASTGSGLLAIAPVPNRFGQEYLVNQAAFVITKPTDPGRLSLGFYGQFFTGADAAFLQGPGDITSTNPRFGDTVRQVYVSAHLPILTEEGVDVAVGRQGTWMGYESYMATARPLYSLSYQWDYVEDGADTGIWTTWHLSKDSDVRYAMTLGSNTFFKLRGDAPCHLFQTNYQFGDEHATKVTGTFLIGNQAVGNVIPYTSGNLDTVVELRVRHDWNERLSQVLQANIGWDQGIPVVSVGQWYGLLGITECAITSWLDGQFRLEWFDDYNGTRTGIATNYYAVTAGLGFHPLPWITFRPELRGDFAGNAAFGPRDSPERRSAQFTAAMECLLRF